MVAPATLQSGLLLQLARTHFFDGLDRRWSRLVDAVTRLLRRRVKCLPAGVAHGQVWSLHPRLVPHMEVPASANASTF